MLSRIQARRALERIGVRHLAEEHFGRVDEDSFEYLDYSTYVRYYILCTSDDSDDLSGDLNVIVSTSTFKQVSELMDLEDDELSREYEENLNLEAVGVCPECGFIEELCICGLDLGSDLSSDLSSDLWSGAWFSFDGNG